MPETYRILYVDDEPDVKPLVLQRMRREIRKRVYSFEFAGNGFEAVDVLSADPTIDLVVSDINMPGMDGLTLLKQIPAINPNLRAIIVSAYGDMKNIRTAMNRGAFDFVTKPLDFRDFRITVERTIDHLVKWREALAARDKLISLNNELSLANQIQQSILPKVFPRTDSFSVFGRMQPARDIGGDFFDVVNLSDSLVGLAIADVSDKGIPAALFMMSSRTLLKGAALGHRNPGNALTEVNKIINADNPTGMFVTVLYAIYDQATNAVTFGNGGHNPPLLVHEDGTSSYLEMPDGIALGVFDGFDYDVKQCTLAPGDNLVLYTDGVTEAMNSEGELFGEERLQDIVCDAVLHGVRDLTVPIVDAVHEYSRGEPQTDDITCMSLSIAGSRRV
ncbi:MAG: SpoIIE family protein phosphatase [Rhodobacteraceae bacterium]|nr:SpoIIE family protein phosphatase [Paracoccaceae bacterium]